MRVGSYPVVAAVVNRRVLRRTRVSNSKVSRTRAYVCFELLLDLSPDEIMAKFDVNKDGVLDKKELNDLMEIIVVKDKGSLERQTKGASDLHISIK